MLVKISSNLRRTWFLCLTIQNIRFNLELKQILDEAVSQQLYKQMCWHF